MGIAVGRFSGGEDGDEPLEVAATQHLAGHDVALVTDATLSSV
jgi:hypothetical protein